MCVGMHVLARVWRPKDNLWESLLCFHLVSLGNQLRLSETGTPMLYYEVVKWCDHYGRQNAELPKRLKIKFHVV